MIFNIDQILDLNGKQLILPPDHLLSLYNMIYPEYDKFLADQLKGKNNLSIIDIGANVGDSLIRILSNDNDYYCIEPDDYFLKYLKINVDNHINNYKNIKIKIINELVGEELEGFLDNKNGTAKISKDYKIGKKRYSKRLDEIILFNKIKKIDVIKCDTDGYDVNVLKSGFKTIKKFKPILFFEYLNIKSSQIKEYINFIYDLNLIGYNKFFILNSYGNIILKDNDIKKIELIMTNKIMVDIYCSAE